MSEFFVKMLEEQYGKEITQKIINGLKVKRYTTFRVNTLKSNIDEVKEVLEKERIEYEKIEWYEDAFVIKKASEDDIRKLDIYNDGKIYLQNLSSMIPPVILDPKPEMDILDMAAAPGGKTTEIASLTNNKANITACEINKIRSERLKYNISKLGANAYVMNFDARNLDNFFSFDKILLDAPCSGSGTLNANKVSENFNIKLIDKCKKRQIDLLKKAIKVLKKGGELVYSTCSVLACENEDIISSVLRDGTMQIVPINFEDLKHIPILPTKIKETLCVCPNEYYEGFFIAKLRK